MKARLLACVILLCAALITKAQYVTIPDPNFVTWLNNNGFSQCMNGNQMDTTCNAVITTEQVYCGNSAISNLAGIQYFDGLRNLICDNNPITSIPILPNTLLNLDCKRTPITSFSTPLPPILMTINCSYCTALTQLPPLPSDNFQNLSCTNSGITSIPSLPSLMYSIEIGGPYLQALPEISSYQFLESFSVDHVNFDSLPILPNSLKQLGLIATGISYIPNLPNTLNFLGVDSCPNLYCLPPFDHTDELSFYLTPISCFSKPFSVNTAYQPIDGIPVCEAGNQHGCQVYEEQPLPNYVTIPDPAFATWLRNNGYASCMIYDQLDTTCSAVISATDIDCRNSNINSIEGIQYFDNLSQLMVEGNNLTSITALPATLTGFYCDKNQLTSLPTLPASLTYLDCCLNYFTTLPTLPPNLVHLFCHEGNLSQLPALPSTLETLECFGNNLTSLPAFPAKLRYVDLHENQINALPALGDSIRRLIMYDNVLTSVPALSPYMEYLEVSLNQISSLPTLPMSLRELHCAENQLTYLPQLPDSLSWLVCSYNPNLACLPKLTKIGNLYFDNTAITCKPNYGNVGQSSPNIGTMPLCNQYNGAGCETYWNVAGRAFVDVNSDCSYNFTDAGQPGVKLTLWSNGILKAQTISNANGDYSFHVVDNGNYEIRIDTVAFPFDVLCPQGLVIYDTVTSVDSLSYFNNFALRCKPGFDLTARNISASGIFRPANTTQVDIYAGALESLYGTNCSQGVSATVQVTITGSATYAAPASGAIAPSTINGNVLTWNVADVSITNTTKDFNVIVRTDTFAQAGQQVCFTVRVTPTVGDRDTTNNTLTHCFTIVNSYDPNDKTAYPSGDIDTAQEWLTYRVRFQNTGNADAQHIYIMDTLDSDLDVASFQLLAYNHNPIMEITGSILKFNFPNINLPDSFSNEPGSHGYVQYKVKLKENLPIGTTIENTAFIYFDFNTPVVTNTAINEITDGTTSVNSAPVAVDDAYAIAQAGTLVADVADNDTDADNDALCIANVWGSVYAAKYAQDSCSNVSYVPDTSFTGTDTVYYSVCDNGQPVLCDTGMTIFIVSRNAALYPVANDDAFTVAQSSTTVADVAANDTHADSEGLCITNIWSSVYATTYTQDSCSSIYYQPDTSYTGADTVYYSICYNGQLILCDTAVAIFTVTYNAALYPVANYDAFNVAQGGTIVADVAANDTHADSEGLCITNIWGSVYATTYTQDSCSSIYYQPDTSFTGADTVYYSICYNGQQILCDTAVAVFTVTYNAALYPIANDDAIVLAQYADSTINVTANDLPGSGNNDFCITSIAGSNNFSIAGCNSITFDADSSFTGQDSCTYIICSNAQPTLCDTAELIVTVTPRIPLLAPVASFAEGQVCDYLLLYNTSTNYTSSTWAVHDFSTMEDTVYTDVDTLELWNGTMVSVCLTVSNIDSSSTYCDTLTTFICPGINEAFAATINIYPNPANNQVMVTAGQAGNTIYMYTAQGKLVATQNMDATAETLNIAELPGGIYYIEVAGKAGTARKKLVKL